MTTYQDQPPRSRRAIRHGERAESSPQEPLFPGSGEPLEYVTQNRAALPGNDAPAHGRRAASPREEHPSEADHQPDAEAPPQRFRRRDYSPENRAPLAPWTSAPPPSTEGGVVEYHTQGRPEQAPEAAAAAHDAAPQPPAASQWNRPHAASPDPAPVAHEAPGAAPDVPPAAAPAEHTMTRRELRALREAHRIGPVTTDGTPVVQESSSADRAHVPADPEPQRPLVERNSSFQSALAEFDALTTGSSMPTAAPASAEPQHAPAPPSQPPVEQAAPVAPPAQVAPPVAPVTPAPVEPAAPHRPAEPSALSTGERPIGHWTNQADIDDAIHGSLSTGSRGVGTGGAITTSALVLPSLPGQDLISGEVMVTGSINLPEALSSTGAHPSQLDQSHLDHLLDAEDEQVVNTDSIPIRAIKAVSSHSSTRGVIAAQKPRGTKALTALIISASGMAVVVVTLLVVAIATNVFGS